MRYYHKLSQVTRDEANDTLLIACGEGDDCRAQVWFGREGIYVNVSATHGPLEMSLRPRQRDLVSSLASLWPTERLSIMRMVGTGQAHLELGLSTGGELLFRTTIVADANGQVAMNMVLTPDARHELFEWLGVKNEAMA